MDSVGWTEICLPMISGGLGVKSLRITNKALLVKWLWRYTRQKTTLWRKTVQQKVKSKEEILMLADDTTTQYRSRWRNITKLGPEKFKNL